jgi:uncharacterized BrkB/YihY/UPF0761 family membrane protein
MNPKELYRIFKASFRDWLDDNATLRAAALTFFIILPLPTLLLIVIAIFALFVGQNQAIQILVQQISTVVGPSVAELFKQLLSNAASPFTSIWTAFVVVGFSFGGAIGLFQFYVTQWIVSGKLGYRKGDHCGKGLGKQLGRLFLCLYLA